MGVGGGTISAGVGVASSGGDHKSGKRCCVAHYWTSIAQYNVLVHVAAARGMHPDHLLAQVMDVVIDDALFTALLDG